MITIFHLEASQSERVIWLMEELALPYRLERFAREADGAAPPAYRALHPFGTAPVIRDGDRVIAESAAIVEYICCVHGGGRLIVEPDEPGYADYLQAMHLNAAIQGALFVRMAHGGDADGDDAPIIVRACRRREDGYFRYLETRLGEAPYLGCALQRCGHHAAAQPDGAAAVRRADHRRPAEHARLRGARLRPARLRTGGGHRQRCGGPAGGGMLT